jgi:hypothetical protein
MENFLHAHLEGDAGMRADPDALLRHVAQHRVQHNTVASLRERINPNENAIGVQQSRAYFVRHFLSVDGRPRMDTDGCEYFERARKAIAGRSCVGPRLSVTAPKDRYLTRFTDGHVEFSQ